MLLNLTYRLPTLLCACLVALTAVVTVQVEGRTGSGSISAARPGANPSALAGTGSESPAGSGSESSALTQQLDTRALNTVEELSESLANDLLALSVAARDKDRIAIERFFAPHLEADVLPTRPGELRSELKWIRTHAWHADGQQSAPLGRTELLNHLERLLEHFSELEDVRFKVKGANFDLAEGNRGSARVWL